MLAATVSGPVPDPLGEAASHAVATASGPAPPPPPPPPEELGSFSQPDAGTGASLTSALVLKLSPVGQRLTSKLSLSECLPAFRRSFAVLAITLPCRLATSWTSARPASLKLTITVSPRRETSMSFSSAGMTSGVGVSTLGACSTATGGGANSCESSGGGVSGTNCATDSFGRTVIVPAQLGSLSSGRTVPLV
jgi:hypothetical protein